MRLWASAVLAASVLWLTYVYVGYPLIVGLLSLVRRARPAARDEYLPSVSVLISARNEERDIGWKATETLAWDYPSDRLEVLVASDGSVDRTDEIVRSLADPRVRLVRIEPRGGKNRALNHLATLARGEVLFFTDANAHIGPGCLRRMVRHLADVRVGCVTGDSYSTTESTASVIGNGASVYWSYESLIKRLESRIGSVLVCDGAIFCIRHELYTPLLAELANDLELPVRIGHAGYWVLHEPDGRVVERDTPSTAQEFARRRRICGQGALAMWKLSSTLCGMRGWQFVSRKFLRWLTLVPMLLVLVSTTALATDLTFRVFVVLQVLFYLCALATWLLARKGHRAPHLLSVPFYVVWGGLGALAGIWDACRGHHYDIWEIPTLSRGRANDRSLARV